MTLCKFYQSGTCRNGNNCRFEHPGANVSNPFGAPASNTNRFGALSNTGGGGGAFGSARPNADSNPYKISKDSIQTDLAKERPSWILSCYGPGRDAPEQLFGGPAREQSIEEARIHVMSSANPQQALSEIQAMHQQAEQQIQTALGNLDGAIQFIIAGENKHPNREDICKQNSAPGGGNLGTFAVGANKPQTNNAFGSQSSNPFSSGGSTGATPNPFSTTTNTQASPFGGGNMGASSTTSAFGQPSALGQKPNPFGSTSSSSTSAFGQPSALGQKPNPFGSSPAFGQPSALGGTSGGSAFGQPSALGQKPNPFGAPSGPSPFGQSSQPAASTGAFGQPSQPGTSKGAFGQPAQPAASTTSAFGQPTALGQKPNPFGAQAASGPSPFGQPAAAAPNPFSQAAPTPAADLAMDTSGPAQGSAPNPFGQPSSASTASPFAAAQSSNPFGAKPSPFGSTANNAPSATPNPFGQPQQQQPQQAVANAPAPAVGKGNPYPPGSSKEHPSIEGYTTRGMNGRIASFQGRPIVWRFRLADGGLAERPPAGGNVTTNPPVAGVARPDGGWMRVMFPDGPPNYNRDTEPEDPASQYTAEVKAAYTAMAATGRFQGDMPEVPPMREDCVWTF